MSKLPKPRSTICWHCGRKLYQGRVFIEKIVDGHTRILHKACAKNAETDNGIDYESNEDPE